MYELLCLFNGTKLIVFTDKGIYQVLLGNEFYIKIIEDWNLIITPTYIYYYEICFK